MQKSDKMVQNIVYTLKNQFMNPFREDLDSDKLYNLVSGRPVSDTISSCLTSLEEEGTRLMENFESRLTGDNMDEPFFTPIKRHKNDSFNNASKKATIKKKTRPEK